MWTVPEQALNYYLIKANWIKVVEEEFISRLNIWYVETVYAWHAEWFFLITDYNVNIRWIACLKCSATSEIILVIGISFSLKI